MSIHKAAPRRYPDIRYGCGYGYVKGLREMANQGGERGEEGKVCQAEDGITKRRGMIRHLRGIARSNGKAMEKLPLKIPKEIGWWIHPHKCCVRREYRSK